MLEEASDHTQKTPPTASTLGCLSALVFAALHLPAVALARLPFSAGVVAYVFLGNGIAGTVFGWVFRRKGLEGAMVAHAAADVWLKAALPALLA